MMIRGARAIPIATLFVFLLIPQALLSQTFIPPFTVITTNTTWDLSGSPFVIDACSVTVAPGATLTIAPGVVVKFALTGPCISSGGSLGISGALVANGTSAQPIFFTSFLDDAAGGDTNGDGSATAPAAGNWGSIFFASGAAGSISHAVVRYGGSTRMIYIASGNASVSLTNSSLTNAAEECVFIIGAGTNPTITGNAFSQNPVGVGIFNNASSSLTGNSFNIPTNGTGISVAFGGTASITNNTFATSGAFSVAIKIDADFRGTLSGNTATGTGLNAVEVQSLGGFPPTLSGNVTWAQVSMPYALTCAGLIVGTGATLTIAPGVVVKFELQTASCNTDLGILGRLVANGTSAQPIVFTSLLDDAVGGDTNGDGSATAPHAVDWTGIFFGPGTAGSISNAVVRYGGLRMIDIETGNSLVSLTNSTINNTAGSSVFVLGAGTAPTISNNTFSQNSLAIEVVGAASPTTAPTIIGNTIFNNSIGVSVSGGAVPHINFNNIQGNSTWGVLNADCRDNVPCSVTPDVDATNNFWGAVNGPSFAGPGSGDKVSFHVNFSPFQAQAIIPGGGGQPAISVSPSPVVFPPTSLARTSSPLVVTIKNPGTATLSVTNITIQNPQSPFQLTNVGPFPISIAASGQVTFSVTFSAKGPGPFSDAISIVSNAPDFPTFFLHVLGTVIIPEMRFDPVPDLLDGPAVTALKSRLATGGRAIQGVAADGVTQIVLRIPAFKGDELVLTVLDNQNTPNPPTLDFGALGNIEDPTIGDPNIPRAPADLPVSAVDTITTAGPMAFAIYRAPIDFVRSGISCQLSPPPPDCAAKERNVFVHVRSRDVSSFDFNIEIKILRPPVVLVHGLWESPSSWDKFNPLICGVDKTDCDPNIKSPRFFIGRVDYTDLVKANNSDPQYDPGVLSQARSNMLGFDTNATKVFTRVKANNQIRGYINEFRSGGNPASIQAAATQADIVAHSMGGNVVRTMALLNSPSFTFLSSDTFGKGFIHKLITIGTPHLGTPVARDLLAKLANGPYQNSCVQTALAKSDDHLIIFKSVTIQGPTTPITINGAVGDLVGDGAVDGNLSPALDKLKKNSDHLPTALIAGVMTPTQLSGLNCDGGTCIDGIPFFGGCGAWKLKCYCKGNPLADNLTVADWPTIVTDSSDAIVPRTSQFNGFSGSQETAVHSSGAVGLGFGGPHEYEKASNIPARVIELLNTPVTREAVFAKK